MKKHILNIIMILLISSLSAQWQPISTGLPDFPPTTIWPFADTVVIGTYGGGLFKTIDNGNSWSDINGDLGNLFVNRIIGHVSYTSMFVATAGGPYYTTDQVTYENCTSSGLDNTDITFFMSGDGTISLDNIIGTFGGGVFNSEDHNGPWTPFNDNLSGDGLFTNDIWGIAEGDDVFYILATEGGIFMATEENPTWIEKNNGITGDALSVQNIVGLGSMALIATHGGAFMTYDACETWTPVLLNEKLNTITIIQSPYSSTGFFVFAFGENGFYSEDFINYFPVDMNGITGEVQCMTTNSTHMFLGVETTTKIGSRGMALYRQPLSLVVGMNENITSGYVQNLGQNFPNPFSDYTTISFNISESNLVNISVYNLQGKQVKEIVDQRYSSGKHTIKISSSELVSGIYHYCLKAGNNPVITKKMIVVN